MSFGPADRSGAGAMSGGGGLLVAAEGVLVAIVVAAVVGAVVREPDVRLARLLGARLIPAAARQRVLAVRLPQLVLVAAALLLPFLVFGGGGLGVRLLLGGHALLRGGANLPRLQVAYALALRRRRHRRRQVDAVRLG